MLTKTKNTWLRSDSAKSIVCGVGEEVDPLVWVSDPSASIAYSGDYTLMVFMSSGHWYWEAANHATQCEYREETEDGKTLLPYPTEELAKQSAITFVNSR